MKKKKNQEIGFGWALMFEETSGALKCLKLNSSKFYHCYWNSNSVNNYGSDYGCELWFNYVDIWYGSMYFWNKSLTSLT